MRHFWIYTGLLLAALLAGAGLWGLVHAVWLPDVPHHKFVKYGALLTAAVALTLWARRRTTRRDLGLDARGGTLLMHLLLGFGTAVVLLLPLWIFLLASGAREADLGLWSRELGSRAAAYLLIGLAVGTLEELYFRGLLLSKATSLLLPATASALLYGGIHFLNPQADAGLLGQWDGGLVLLLQAACGMPDAWLAEAPRLALLVLVGFGLALVRLRTGQLALCIGAHAAMVFSLKTFQKFTDAGTAPFDGLGTDPLGGWAAAFWIGLLVVALWRYLGDGPRRPAATRS